MKTAALSLLAVLVFGSLAARATVEPRMPQTEPASPEAERSEDPVCHMMVKRDPDLSAEHDGQVYYFCMKKDLEAFIKDPQKYLDGDRHDHPDPNARTPAD